MAFVMEHVLKSVIYKTISLMQKFLLVSLLVKELWFPGSHFVPTTQINHFNWNGSSFHYGYHTLLQSIKARGKRMKKLAYFCVDHVSRTDNCTLLFLAHVHSTVLKFKFVIHSSKGMLGANAIQKMLCTLRFFDFILLPFSWAI